MIKIMTKKILCLFILIILPNILKSAQNQPITIPSLRQWIRTDGNYYFRKYNRIIISENDYDDLIDDIRTFNEDLLSMYGFELIVLNGSKPINGDIYFTIKDNDADLGDEGYTMSITDHIVIIAPTKKGIFYATRTLLQLFKLNNTIPSGFIKDFPDRKERALQVDNGRKYFSISWLENHIKELSYLKMNYFYFYLSDNYDFRLESSTDPMISSKQHYTKQEIRDLIKLANKYHVKIVPVIDMPAHMGALLINQRDTLCLKNKYGQVHHSKIDITLDTARKFIKKIIEEYIELFDSPYWHLGADEYIYTELDEFPQFLNYAQKHYGNDAIALDAYFDFINWANKIVRSYGKTLRIYNDCISIKNNYKLQNKVKIDTNIIVDYWEGKDMPNELIEEGFYICNSAINFLYYILGSGWTGYNEFLYEKFLPNIYNENRKVPLDHKQNLGARFHIWCDSPNMETEGHIANEIRNTLRAFSTKLWGGPLLVDTYSEFKVICDNIGLAPQVNFPTNPIPDNLCWKKKIWTSSNSNDLINPAYNINDASYNTCWNSKSNNNEWIIIDLDSLYKIDSLKFVFMKNYPKEFSISFSKDSLEWEELPFSEINKKIFEIKNLTAIAKYLKIDLKSTNELDSVFAIWEIEAYGKLYLGDSNVEQHNNNKIKISPNPAYTYIDLDVNDYCIDDIEIDIFDIYGNQRYSNKINCAKNLSVERINIQNLEQGVYSIFIKSDYLQKYQKFVIMK